MLVSADESAANLLPRGPGREPMRSLRRSSYVIVTRKSAATDAALLLETKIHQLVPGVATARAHLAVASPLPTDPFVVATAIARPDLLLAQLMQAGSSVHAFMAYPDHRDFTEADVAHIRQRAANHLLVVTAKDAVKLRDRMPEQPLFVVEQELVFESGAGELMSAVDNVL